MLLLLLMQQLISDLANYTKKHETSIKRHVDVGPYQ